jgi:hypothetical protein
MNPIPKILIVDLSIPLKILDRLSTNAELPTVDVDAILSVMFEAIVKPNLTGKKFDDHVKWLMENNNFNQIHLDQEDYLEALGAMQECLITIRNDIKVLNPYCNGVMPYEYKQRRGKISVLLEKRPSLLENITSYSYL